MLVNAPWLRTASPSVMGDGASWADVVSCEAEAEVDVGGYRVGARARAADDDSASASMVAKSYKRTRERSLRGRRCWTRMWDEGAMSERPGGRRCMLGIGEEWQITET